MIDKILNYLAGLKFILEAKWFLFERKLRTGKELEISPKGQKMIEYCIKIMEGKDNHKDYAETLLEEDIMNYAESHNCTRKESARSIGLLFIALS